MERVIRNEREGNLEEKFYAAYGINMHLSQMTYRCPHAELIGKSELKDFSLRFRGQRYNAFATVEPTKGENVPVLIWKVQKSDEAALDRYEGYPYFYEKKDVNVVLNGEQISAMAYVMTPNHGLGMPSRDYLCTIMDAYHQADLNTDALLQAVMYSAEGMSQQVEITETIQNLKG